MSVSSRVSRLRAEFAELEVDGFLVSRPENRRLPVRVQRVGGGTCS